MIKMQYVQTKMATIIQKYQKCSQKYSMECFLSHCATDNNHIYKIRYITSVVSYEIYTKIPLLKYFLNIIY